MSLIIDGDFGAREIAREMGKEEEELDTRASALDDRDSLGRKPAIRYDDDSDGSNGDDDDEIDGGKVRKLRRYGMNESESAHYCRFTRG